MSINQLMTAITRKSLVYAQGVAVPYAEGAMNSLIIISRVSDGSYDESGRAYTPPSSTVIYTDPDFPELGAKAGIEPTSGPLTMNIGEEMQYWSSIRLHIPEKVVILPRVDDIIEITYNQTAGVVGRKFKIGNVDVGGRISPSITMTAEGVAPHSSWEA